MLIMITMIISMIITMMIVAQMILQAGALDLAALRRLVEAYYCTNSRLENLLLA